MAKKGKKAIIGLTCSECKSFNYTEYKSQNLKEKLVKNKYCKVCKKHTDHKESKLK